MARNILHREQDMQEDTTTLTRANSTIESQAPEMDSTQTEDTVTLGREKADQLSIPDWTAHYTPTNIDRQQCYRIRPMEVLCLGLERTGTLSTRVALLRLGYFDTYHFSSFMIENPPDQELWIQAIDAKFNNKGTFGKEDWDKLLGHCMAVTDQPCATFAAELLSAYPSAKIILTTRDSAEAWHASLTATVKAFVDIALPDAVRKPGLNPFNWLRWLLHPRSPFLEKWQGALDKQRGDWAGKHVYEEHNAWVRELVREQGRELLEFNVKEGWEPLCAFLGKSVPVGVEFPRVNEKEGYQRILEREGKRVVRAYVQNALKWVGVVVVGVAIWKGVKA